MTSKSGFFVFILIASGCLSKACGEGQIGASPRSGEVAPTPTPANVDEPTSDQPDVARPAGSLGDPYVHVTPADIGVSVGPGVIAPYPTVQDNSYCSGITQDGTTIENRVVNCSGKFRIDADNVTIRNSVITANDGFHIGYDDGVSLNFLIEYSHIDVPNGEVKAFQVWGGPHDQNRNFSNFTIRKSHIEGGFDFFDMSGNLDGALFENSVVGPSACDIATGIHSDGWQIGGNGSPGGWGNITIRGNWIDRGSECYSAGLWYGAYGAMNTTIESNRIPTYGANTLWASDADTMRVRYNVYSSTFQSQVGNRCGNSSCGGSGQDPCCAYPNNAASWDPIGAPLGSAVCNRYEDGSFVENEYFANVTHVTTGCPDYP